MRGLLKKIGVSTLVTAGIISGGAYLLNNPSAEANSTGQRITPIINYNHSPENPPIPEPSTGILVLMGTYVIANRFFGRDASRRKYEER